MTRVTFGVSSSSFAANMCVKQNALDHASKFPLASEAVHKSYVDDGLTGSDTVEEASTQTSERVTVTVLSCGIPPSEVEHN